MTYVIRLQSLKLEQTNFKKKDNYYRKFNMINFASLISPKKIKLIFWLGSEGASNKLYINWANKCEGICTHI